MTYEFGALSSYGYGYNAEIGVMPPQPAYVPGQSPGMNYYPTQTIGVAPYAPVSSGSKPMGYDTGYSGYISHPYVYNPPQATGGKTMYDYGAGYSSSYSPSYTSGSVPNYVDVTPSSFTYGNPVAPAIEQAGTTADNPYGPYTGGYVQVTPSNFTDPYAPYTGPGVTVTPNQLYNYYQPQPQTSRSPSGGGGGGPSGGSSGQSPQRQQPQQQRPVTIQINTGVQHPARRSGSGYTGGNTGAIYNPNRQYAGNNYGGAASYGSQYGQGSAMANYNAPSIVPYLLIGGIGIAGYMMLKKHH